MVAGRPLNAHAAGAAVGKARTREDDVKVGDEERDESDELHDVGADDAGLVALLVVALLLLVILLRAAAAHGGLLRAGRVGRAA